MGMDIFATIGMIGNYQIAGIQAEASANAAREATAQAKAKQSELNAGSELARSIQKINNDRIMRAADKTYAAAATNLTRNRAANQTNSLMTQVATAEATGAYAAHVASKGIGGGSVEAIEHTMALRDSLKAQLTKDANSQADYDAVQTLAGIIPAGWQQQDTTVLSGNTSSAAAIPTVSPGFNWASALSKSGAGEGIASLLSNQTTGNAGNGLSLGSSGEGLSASKSGFWTTTSSSTGRL